MKIRKGDTIQVIAGKDAGKQGKVDVVYTKNNTIASPELNMYKKHVQKSEAYPQGGVVQLARPLDVSKVMVVCPSCKKATRIGYKIVDSVKKRFCKKCDAII